MAKRCVLCDKRPQATSSVSHAHNVTRRWVYPNVHKIHYKLPNSSCVHTGTVCTKCMKRGKITKIV